MAELKGDYGGPMRQGQQGIVISAGGMGDQQRGNPGLVSDRETNLPSDAPYENEKREKVSKPEFQRFRHLLSDLDF